jgi:hypothetical protein
MGSVRNPNASAWVPSGTQFPLLTTALIVPFGMRPGPDDDRPQPGAEFPGNPRPAWHLTFNGAVAPHHSSSLGVAMNDFWAIFITVVVFAVLFLIVKGVERIER